MTSSRRHVRPVVVEVQPSNLTPLSTSPSSAKAVRFAPSSNNAISRPLNTTEAWSLYHFEYHARHCPHCYEPHKVFLLRGGRLCPIGHGLAQDVAYHVYHLNGEFYSTVAKDNAAKLVRVEIPAPYFNLRGLLRSMDRALRSHYTQRPAPIISYDRTYPIPTRRSIGIDTLPERPQVILEPATSPRKEKKKSHDHDHSRQSKHKAERYSTVKVDSPDAVDSGYEYDDGDYSVKAPSFPAERRKSAIYETDSQRRRENYRVEIREPDAPRRIREQRRSSMFWD